MDPFIRLEVRFFFRLYDERRLDESEMASLLLIAHEEGEIVTSNGPTASPLPPVVSRKVKGAGHGGLFRM